MKFKILEPLYFRKEESRSRIFDMTRVSEPPVTHLKTSTTVTKAFAILDFLASNAESGASLAAISSRLGISKSTAHRYMATLEELAVVERDAKDHFRLGVKLIELAGAVLSNHSLHKVSEPFLRELATRTQETVHLATPSGDEVVYIAKIESTHTVGMTSRIGARVPMYCTALGKSILAHYPVERIKEIIRGGLLARTPHTITSPVALHAELERVRAQGYAVDDQENELGVRCVGAPIFDYTGNVVGAISVSGPADRMTLERSLELAPWVRDAAYMISKRMGYSR
ncbi:MAG: IclR family transcriptional regulator [Anaerolineae bacterium]|nr:IclR family transcriptional regulator [Anaerolineae bacterium]MDW8070518.1 IclR family transcriptional regulator [Anaerolineae bacterium]